MPAPIGNNNNPTGKGGFQERPQDIARGRWSGETSISYNYNKLIRMTLTEITEWLENNPDDKRTMAQDLAYKAVLNARDDLAYLKEVTDRTEGKAQQNITNLNVEVEQDETKSPEERLKEVLDRIKRLQES